MAPPFFFLPLEIPYRLGKEVETLTQKLWHRFFESAKICQLAASCWRLIAVTLKNFLANLVSELFSTGSKASKKLLFSPWSRPHCWPNGSLPYSFPAPGRSLVEVEWFHQLKSGKNGFTTEVSNGSFFFLLEGLLEGNSQDALTQAKVYTLQPCPSFLKGFHSPNTWGTISWETGALSGFQWHHGSCKELWLWRGQHGGNLSWIRFLFCRHADYDSYGF